jgi:hypothetical protein
MDRYAQIRSRDLPVGSGEAESGVRHLIKRRMSIAGAWTEEHADLMLALITIRASGWWDDFWRWRDRRDRQDWHQRQQDQHRPRFRAHRAEPMLEAAA